MEGPPAGVDEEIHHRQPEARWEKDARSDVDGVIHLSMLLLQRRTPWLPLHPHTHWPSQNVTLCVVVGYDLIKVSEQLCKSDLDIPIKRCASHVNKIHTKHSMSIRGANVVYHRISSHVGKPDIYEGTIQGGGVVPAWCRQEKMQGFRFSTSATSSCPSTVGFVAQAALPLYYGRPACCSDQMKFIRRDAKQPGMTYRFAPNRLSEAMGKANTTTCLLLWGNTVSPCHLRRLLWFIEESRISSMGIGPTKRLV
ncbi:hypothetical protein ACQJBY_057500 [Aegilops geniculata]